MHPTGKQLLELMFREDEQVCVSPNKFGYHSIPLYDALSDRVTLIPPTPEGKTLKPLTDQLLLVALNPIVGQRTDANCVAYRNFLVELDTGTLEQQESYVKARKMPYSACVFSGNKSLHYLISLDEDLANEEEYRMFSEWILNIMTVADQNCKNPSRSIRVPGAVRDTGKMQELRELNGQISVQDFGSWLKTYPTCVPRIVNKRAEVPSETPDLKKLKLRTKKKLVKGLDPKMGRNAQWFMIACDFATAGFSEDDAIDVLLRYFNEDRDFKTKEWKAAIKSGFKHVNKR